MDVASWLRNLGLEQYEATFRQNDVDAGLLPNLTADDLKDLGITSVGHRRHLLEAIAALRLEGAPAADDPIRLSASLAGNLGSSETSAERRPLSVMFCDLIGSTALSSRLDPEDLRELIRTYQARVAATIQQFDGFIARYVGDGVLIYFGWPEARETDAERAVRAGLAVAAAVSATQVSGEPLQVRVGIATGLVVIGEPIGSGDSRQQTAVGETPNLAARLQSLAGPGQVVIDAATRRQIGGLFECLDLGTVELKGLPAAVPAWQVVSENRAVGQFEALRSGATPLVGRDEEMELLLRRWTQAKAGNGRVVLISAEPGVGKSRLAEALAGRIAGEPHTRLRYFCSPHHQDSALYPVIAQMERAAGFRLEDDPAARFAKLQALLAATAPPTEDVALIAELHALPSAEIAPPPDLTPQRKKEKTFEALLRQVEGLTCQQPVLMIFDDLHWIDPSSRELLDRTIERIAGSPVLLLAIFRPEFQAPWTGLPHVTMLALARLDRRDTAAMIANVAGSAALPPEIMEEIAERTDGVPLFVEELTKSVIEAGTLRVAALSLAPHPSVPATLHASLMSRLDRLGAAAKDIAQTGATIGREFDYGLLASVTDQPQAQLRAALDRLTNAGLLFVRGTPPQSSYIFKHALIQDAAYGTLLRGPRQQLHAQIATVLESHFPDVVAAEPAVLAQHCEAAGLTGKAVGYWLDAGRQAIARFAMTEAISQLRKGLALISRLPDAAARQPQELDLTSLLGHALMATKGFSAPESGKLYDRARRLCEQLGRPRQLASALHAQFVYRFVRAELDRAEDHAHEMLRLGEQSNDVKMKHDGLYLSGMLCFVMGKFSDARAYCEASLALWDPGFRTFTASPEDPYVANRAYYYRASLYLGHLDQARSVRSEAVTEARRLSPFNLAFVLCFVSSGDWAMAGVTGAEAMLRSADEILAISNEHGFAAWVAIGKIIRGWCLAILGQAGDGIELALEGLAGLRNAGCRVYGPFWLALLAEAYGHVGQFDEALERLAEADRMIETTQEAWPAAELHRMRGQILLKMNDRAAAENSFGLALDVARRQNAKFWELRASICLARLWCDQGKHAEARDLLGPIYSWFTEGFDAPDLKDVKALLEQLTS